MLFKNYNYIIYNFQLVQLFRFVISLTSTRDFPFSLPLKKKRKGGIWHFHISTILQWMSISVGKVIESPWLRYSQVSNRDFVISLVADTGTNSSFTGSTPYPDMTAREVMRNVQNGYRLERPSHCRSELFRVISRCWHADPDRRPEFQTLRRDLAQLLEDNMNGHYVDLESFASECTDWAFISIQTKSFWKLFSISTIIETVARGSASISISGHLNDVRWNNSFDTFEIVFVYEVLTLNR